ncbi:zinc finger and BTB domain-containing protein 47-like [Dipodomys spectabilis]|uniref:zinc finger and BTB domain-containing protein 47-like n=1 Tax=Dipodomys spectabilis TaxID=105255 RepID=UPI001C5410A8|nr:zinc finger and BTB domain-containing protein 47-like [Dipodomys spectabilis]
MSLKVHSLQHSGEKPFRCENCNERFQYKYQLRSHMSITTSDTSSSCASVRQGLQHEAVLRRAHEDAHRGEAVHLRDLRQELHQPAQHEAAPAHAHRREAVPVRGVRPALPRFSNMLKAHREKCFRLSRAPGPRRRPPA